MTPHKGHKLLPLKALKKQALASSSLFLNPDAILKKRQRSSSEWSPNKKPRTQSSRNPSPSLKLYGPTPASKQYMKEQKLLERQNPSSPSTQKVQSSWRENRDRRKAQRPTSASRKILKSQRDWDEDAPLTPQNALAPSRDVEKFTDIKKQVENARAANNRSVEHKAPISFEKFGDMQDRIGRIYGNCYGLDDEGKEELVTEWWALVDDAMRIHGLHLICKSCNEQHWHEETVTKTAEMKYDMEGCDIEDIDEGIVSEWQARFALIERKFWQEWTSCEVVEKSDEGVTVQPSEEE